MTAATETGRARRALVTGASSGIGAATARCLAAAGYRVALLARRAERLDEVLGSLPACPEGAHLALTCDLRDPDAVERAFARLDEAFGGLELLVNNAGVGYRATVAETDAQHTNAVFETNVTGLLLCCRHAHPLLRRGARPVVVNITSVIARRGFPGMAVYGASKAAVTSISEALRLEWAADGIAVCNLGPNVTATEFMSAQPNPSGLPLPDLSGATDPAEIAALVLELDRHPEPERILSLKWRMLSALSVLMPRSADRLLGRRVDGSGSASGT